MPIKVDNAVVSTSAPPARTGGVLECSGSDALVFLQAQCMNDVRLLQPGEWQWNGWLNAKGRVLALFALLRLDATRVWLVLPDAEPAALREALARFVFRSKVTLAPREDLASIQFAARAPHPDAAGRRCGLDPDGSVWLDLSGARPRCLLIAPEAQLARVRQQPPGPELAPDRIRAEDLVHGLPRGAAAVGGAYTPQMLGLARLNAYSVKKGCYPGQEIVARTHFLGEAKRSLQRVRGLRSPRLGEHVVQATQDVGEIVCTAENPDFSEALALLPAKLEASAELRLADDASPLVILPFDTGLER